MINTSIYDDLGTLYLYPYALLILSLIIGVFWRRTNKFKVISIQILKIFIFKNIAHHHSSSRLLLRENGFISNSWTMFGVGRMCWWNWCRPIFWKTPF